MKLVGGVGRWPDLLLWFSIFPCLPFSKKIWKVYHFQSVQHPCFSHPHQTPSFRKEVGCVVCLELVVFAWIKDPIILAEELYVYK